MVVFIISNEVLELMIELFIVVIGVLFSVQRRKGLKEIFILSQMEESHLRVGCCWRF